MRPLLRAVGLVTLAALLAACAPAPEPVALIRRGTVTSAGLGSSTTNASSVLAQRQAAATTAPTSAEPAAPGQVVDQPFSRADEGVALDAVPSAARPERPVADDPVPVGAARPARPTSASSAGAQSSSRSTGRIDIPSIGLSHDTFEGIEMSSIDRGPSHWPGTADPGERGNTVFPGHRTTKTRPFWDIDLIRIGDDVVFTTPAGRFTYDVTKAFVVDDEDTSIVDQTEDATFTIFACHPKGSARQRYVVQGVLVAAARTASPSSPPPQPPSSTTTTTTTQPRGIGSLLD